MNKDDSGKQRYCANFNTTDHKSRWLSRGIPFLFTKAIIINSDFLIWFIKRNQHVLNFSHLRISAPPHIFRGNWGTGKHQRSSPYFKSSPRSNQNTYLSSCHVCKPALNSVISAVPSRSHCSYSPHDCTIDQLTIFSRAAIV